MTRAAAGNRAGSAAGNTARGTASGAATLAARGAAGGGSAGTNTLTTPTRRHVLALGAAGLAGVGFTALTGCSTMSTSSVTEPDSFDTPLPIPPEEYDRLEGGIRTFALTAQEGTWQFRPGATTATPASTWGFNAPYGGPTLRANVGDRVAIDAME